MKNCYCLSMTLKRIRWILRSKHFDVQYHFIRDRYMRGDVSVEFVSTEEQRAHVMTKALSGPKFERAVRMYVRMYVVIIYNQATSTQSRECRGYVNMWSSIVALGWSTQYDYMWCRLYRTKLGHVYLLLFQCKALRMMQLKNLQHFLGSK